MNAGLRMWGLVSNPSHIRVEIAALVPVQVGFSHVSQDEDKHKAPIDRHIRPLSLHTLLPSTTYITPLPNGFHYLT